MSDKELDPQLSALLEQHKEYFSLHNGKIKCHLNDHCFPPRLDAVSAFINGSKFAKLVQLKQAETALSKYEPFIVPSMNFPTMLYCALTGQLIAKSMDAVKLHMKGKKFIRAKERFTSDQQELKPEPTLESFGIRLPKDGNGEAAARGKKAGSRGDQKMLVEGDEEGNEECGIWVPAGVESDQAEEDDDGEEGEDASSDLEEASSSDAMEHDGEQEAAGDAMDEDKPASAPRSMKQQSSKKEKVQQPKQKLKQQKQQKQQQQQQQKPAPKSKQRGKAAGGSSSGKQREATDAAAVAAAVIAAAGSSGGKAPKRNPNKPTAAKKTKR